MAVEVAHACLEGAPVSSLLFCSRYGEYARTFELLTALADQQPLSPAAFSASVHNTSAALCSMAEGHHGTATAVAAGVSSLEHAFLDGWMQLRLGEATSLVLVFHDEPLPAPYPQPPVAMPGGFALALRLVFPGNGIHANRLRLSWNARPDGWNGQDEGYGSALDLVRLLTGRLDRAACRDARLIWTWCAHEPA